MKAAKEKEAWIVEYIPMSDSRYKEEKSAVILKKTYPRKFEIAYWGGEIHVFCLKEDIHDLKKQEHEIMETVRERLWHLRLTKNIDL